MSAHAEAVLIGHLVDTDALKVIAFDGLNVEILPTPELRPLLTFALDYYFASGCQRAPSVTILKDQYADALADGEIDLDTEPEDSVEWAIDDLKATWVHKKVSRFNKDLAAAMAAAPKPERVDVVNEYGTKLVSLGLSLESRAYRMDLREAGDGLIRGYESRAASRGQFRGMGIGLPEVDAHTNGIQDGELAIFLGGPKSGKSYIQCWVALQEWKRNRAVTLFTLENSVDMMLSRIACMELGIDASAWEHGECSEEEIERVSSWVEVIKLADVGLWVLKPDLGQRSFQHMVREAELRGADSLLIDQLTHVELGQGISDHRPRTEKIGEGLELLKGMISTGRRPMPCFLTHQIKRDGVAAAAKRGYYVMEDGAESAYVERTCDHAMALYASREEKAVRQAKLQQLASRRTAIKNWQITWRPEVGGIRVRNEIDIEQQ